MEGTFQTDFKECYQRNRNSRSQTKNLRCFPQCCTDGHISNGFCGQRVVVLVDTSMLPSSDILVAYAKFGIHGSKEEDLPKRVLRRGEVRNDGNFCCPWIKVNVLREPDGRTHMTINPELLGWHYAWRSNKNTRDIGHSLKLFLFKLTTGDAIKLLCEVSSKPFVMYSGTSKTSSARKKLGKRLAKDSVENEDDVKPVSVLSKKKLDPSKAVIVHPVKYTLRELLTCVFTKLKADAMAQIRGESTAGITNASEFDERRNVLTAKMDEFESIQLVEDLLNDDDLFQALALNQEEGLKKSQYYDLAMDEALHSQVLDSLTSEDLTDKVSAFLDECSKGPIGKSLVEILETQTDGELENHFLHEFTKNLFAKFQRIISGRIEEDLFSNGFLQARMLSRSVRGATDSTVAEFGSRDEDDGLVFDPNDIVVLRRFLKLICTYCKGPDVTKWIEETVPESPYLLCNRVWKMESKPTTWLDVSMQKFTSVLPQMVRKVTTRFEKKHHRYAEDGFVSIKGVGVLSFNGCITLICDGEVHSFETAPPLFIFMEPPERRYVSRHEIEDDGSYVHKACFQGHRPEMPKYFVFCNTVRVSSSDPDVMYGSRKIWVRESELSDEGMKCVVETGAVPGEVAPTHEWPLKFRAQDKKVTKPLR